MAVNRANAIINQNITLGMEFYKNGSLYDPFAINFVQFIAPDDVTVIQTIPSGSIVQVSLGKYQVEVSGVSIADTYHDKWYYEPENGANVYIEVASVVVMDVSASPDAVLDSIIDDIRLDIGDDGPNPKFSDQQLLDFVEKAAKRLAKYFKITIIGGEIVEELNPTQISLLTLQAECLITKRIFIEETGKGIKAKLGPTSIDTTAKFDGLKEISSGGSSPCKDLEKLLRDCLLDGSLDGGSGGIGII